MPAQFQDFFSRRTDLFLPAVFQPAEFADNRRTNEFLSFIGRLAPGVTLERAQLEMHAFAVRLRTTYTNSYASDWDLKVTGLSDEASRGVRSGLLILLGAVAGRAADRLRERRKPAAGPDRRPRARPRRARGPRGVAASPGALPPHRERRAGAGRRRARRAPRPVGRAGAAVAQRRESPAPPRASPWMLRFSPSRCSSRWAPGSYSASRRRCRWRAPICTSR